MSAQVFRRDVPAVHRFLADPDLAGFAALFGSTVVKAAVDDVLRDARMRASEGNAVAPFEQLLGRVRARLAREESESLVEVLNATGILLHTNLGRAPLADAALAAMARIGRGYSNLEFDLDAGARGSRYARVSTLLAAVTGAQDGLVVNNCAAAVLLVLDTFAKGREVVVSRNQLVEIGGGFRLPDVLARSGATLVEVGATNKVYVRDFAQALTPQTALLLRSHTSNYRIEGFSADVAPRELADLGRRAGVTTVEDLGGGALVDLAAYGLPHERTVQEAVSDGLDLVAFSGDKLLGGPQAGLVVGRRSALARLRANPLLRALRVDKSTLAALAETLRLYLQPAGVEQIPVFAMLGTSVERLRTRAERLRSGLPAPLVVEARPLRAYAGGGSAPLATIASYGLVLRHPGCGASALAATLRAGRPRVVARIDDGALVVDLRSVAPERDAELATALAALSLA